MNSTNTAIVNQETLLFDLNEACLQLSFDYELDSFRARKNWINTLKEDFLLEINSDIDIAVEESSTGWNLVCFFNSATARYVFWKIINSQAPKTSRSLIGLPIKEEKPELSTSKIKEILNVFVG